MTAPIVTPETTLRELGEILERRGLSMTAARRTLDEPWTVAVCGPEEENGEGWDESADLAVAIDAALAKAGAR